MVILEPLSSSQGNVSYLWGGAVPVQSDGFNSALSPVVYGDTALSINTQYNLKMYLPVKCYQVYLSRR